MAEKTKQQEPVLMRDPRFVAGRQTMGQSTSVDIFALLLEEIRSRYGPDHFETAPAYYEYGNALFRAAQRQDEAESPGVSTDTKLASASVFTPVGGHREAAAMAAERRAKEHTIAKVNADDHDDAEQNSTSKAKTDTIGGQDETSRSEEDTANVDILLALEMMENAFAILDSTNEAKGSPQSNKYGAWIRQQMPRILTGIGDVLSALNRHADAVDAYLRALGHRQEILDDAHAKSTKDASPEDLMHLLLCRRLVAEANTLVVEELLASDLHSEITTTETKSILVPKGKVIEYATGYYERARDELQETVFLMGQLQSEGHELGNEKENICFAATLIMAAAESLAAIDESLPREPNKKKSKLL